MVKDKKMHVKLEASLKEIKQRRLAEITKLLLKREKVEVIVAESAKKKLEERDAKL